MAETLLTIKETADFMRVDERTVRRWIALGRLKPLRIGNTIRLKKSEIIEVAINAQSYLPPEGMKKKEDPMMG